MKVKINNFEIELEQLPNGKFKKPDLAKKYEGYKYSISPLKQTNETIMVFRKPYKSGSCLHDTLAFENGDNECRCGALNIDGNRVETTEVGFTKNWTDRKSPAGFNGDVTGIYGSGKTDNVSDYEPTGRYPSQTLCGGVNLTIMVLDDTIDLETKNEIRSCYDELYLQSLREKVLSIAVKSEEWQGEVLHKGLLLPGSKSDNERKKSSELWEKENTRNNSQVKKDLGIKGQEQGTFSELEGWHNKGKGLHNGRLSELPGKILGYATTNDQKEQQDDITTQNCDGYTLEQSINEGGHSSPQEWSEKRQPSGEFGNIQPTKSLSFTQRSREEDEGTNIANRTFTERDTFIEKEFIPEKWLKHFTYACDILVSTAEVLDKQSGISKGGGAITKHIKNVVSTMDFASPNVNGFDGYSDIGGCSKILHKCDYEKEDYDIYNYQPKVSKSERNAGCDEFEDSIKGYGNLRNEENNNFDNKKSMPVKNNHPTLKPIALNEKILKLFKTPNDDKIVYPFAGSGSEVIGGLKAGFTNWVGCEINPEYVEIAKARIDYWTTQDKQVSIFDIEREVSRL